jgi:RimJ/RimL family protein N-acetyltransferase
MNMRRELKSSRLQLEPCRLEDALPVHELWTNPHIRHFLFDEREISLDETRLFIETSLANFEQYGYGLWLVFEADEHHLIGFAGLLQSESNAPNLIYGVHPDFWGRGYATEAASAVLTYAREMLGLPLIKADVDEPNAASVRVLTKLGMKQTNRAVIQGRPLLYFEESGLARAG